MLPRHPCSRLSLAKKRCAARPRQAEVFVRPDTAFERIVGKSSYVFGNVR